MNKFINEDNSKLAYITKLEIKKDKQTEISDKEKYFITFPYPYMNGKLHLGHLFSISKSDFMAYYKEMKGFNVLFPLSFHCTGMPISASAKKLEEELDGKVTDISTKRIIESLGFKDVTPFQNPLHWIKVFPPLCKQDLQKFGANIDWRRSFITTEVNKYYDSFIKWQFCKLRDLGYLSFGKRHSIYCPKDNQPCLDHDRRKGENVKPIQYFFYKINFGTFVLLCQYKSEGTIKKIVYNENLELVYFEVDGTQYLAENVVFDNLKYQVSDVKYIGIKKLADLDANCVFDGCSIEMETVDVKGIIAKTNKAEIEKYKQEIDALTNYESNNTNCENRLLQNLQINNSTKDFMLHTTNFVSVWMPEDEVISRAGGICVVSLLDQWYIDYCDVSWKKKVKLCLSKMICDEDTRSKLEEGLEWISKWGFSRSFGLGTKIPWDNQYLIDSLSDSTIYMSMYTFKHLLYKNLDGTDEIFPSAKLSNDVWDYILHDDELHESLLEYRGILNECRKNFRYFYPVDLRVSGKDLIRNHLLFYLFNHVALFKEEQWPRRIYTNGHLMLNSEKMSKSSGNFLTVEDAFTKFGVSATRMCLAVCGDTNEDANFVEANANSFILRLHTFVKNIEELPKIQQINYSTKSNIDRLIEESISFYIRETEEAYKKMKYSDVIKNGFFELSHLRNIYKSLNGTNNELIWYLYKTMTQLLYPIIPDLCRHLLNTYFANDVLFPIPPVSTNNMLAGFAFIKEVCKKIVTHKSYKSSQEVIIGIGNEYPTWKQNIMKYIDNLDIDRSENIKSDKELVKNILADLNPILKKYGISQKKGNMFTMDYLMHLDKYTTKFDEREILNDFKGYIEEMTGRAVFFENSEVAEPSTPSIKFN